MEVLQDKIKKLQEEKGKPITEVALALDVSTRWNSIIKMLDSLFKVESWLGFLSLTVVPKQI